MPVADGHSNATASVDPDARRRGADGRSTGRLGGLDLLRGLLIVLMAIDYASYFVANRHPNEFSGMPLPAYTDVASFLTRAVTHVAAPGFFLLMGASMVLLADSRLRAGWSEARLLRYFAVRGLLLVLLQIFVENPAWLLGTVQRTPVGTDPPDGGGLFQGRRSGRWAWAGHSATGRSAEAGRSANGRMA